MARQSELIITQKDYEKIIPLVQGAQTEIAELLEEELSRASIVEETALPKDVVAMGSKVLFTDTESKKNTEIYLVYPHQANIEENKVSVLTPVGAALIGLQVGQTIVWPLPNGQERHLKVISVQQEEARS